jgi:hypothetical protein
LCFSFISISTIKCEPVGRYVLFSFLIYPCNIMFISPFCHRKLYITVPCSHIENITPNRSQCSNECGGRDLAGRGYGGARRRRRLWPARARRACTAACRPTRLMTSSWPTFWRQRCPPRWSSPYWSMPAGLDRNAARRARHGGCRAVTRQAGRARVPNIS